MDTEQIAQINGALSVLEDQFRGKAVDLPDYLKERAVRCLSTMSGREFPNEAVLEQQSQGSSSKRSANTASDIQGLFKAFKAIVDDLEKLIGSTAESIGQHAETSNDPREADIQRLQKPSSHERLAGLLAMRSLHKDLVLSKEQGKKRFGKSHCEKLAASLSVRTTTIQHIRTYGNKSQEFVDEYGSDGILWFLVYFVRRWRYFPRDGIRELVILIKEDPIMSQLAASEKWHNREQTYQLEIQKRRAVESQTRRIRYLMRIHRLILPRSNAIAREVPGNASGVRTQTGTPAALGIPEGPDQLIAGSETLMTNLYGLPHTSSQLPTAYPNTANGSEQISYPLGQYGTGFDWGQPSYPQPEQIPYPLGHYGTGYERGQPSFPQPEQIPYPLGYYGTGYEWGQPSYPQPEQTPYDLGHYGTGYEQAAIHGSGQPSYPQPPIESEQSSYS